MGGPLDIDWVEEDKQLIDMDRSIATESTRGCLDKKKKFLINFLTRKLVELGNRKTSPKNLNIDRPHRNSLQLKKGDKIFQVNKEESDPEEESPKQWHSELEIALSAAVGDPPKPKYKKGPCPLHCEFLHPNKSVFFCEVFRKKTLDEKRALVKNAGLCALCLARNSKGHTYPVLKCPRCSGGHSIQLCQQEDQDPTLVGAEEDGSSEDEEEIKAWLDNRDWPEMHALSCKEDLEEGSTNVHTLRDIYSQDIILTLMDPSTLKSNDPDDDSEGGPTAPLTPTSPIPKEKT